MRAAIYRADGSRSILEGDAGQVALNLAHLQAGDVSRDLDGTPLAAVTLADLPATLAEFDAAVAA